jgi:hypothetical protein
MAFQPMSSLPLNLSIHSFVGLLRVASAIQYRLHSDFESPPSSSAAGASARVARALPKCDGGGFRIVTATAVLKMAPGKTCFVGQQLTKLSSYA